MDIDEIGDKRKLYVSHVVRSIAAPYMSTEMASTIGHGNAHDLLPLR